MASNRREWQASLRSKVMLKEKKPKIQILSNVLYKKGDETKLIKKSPTTKIKGNEEENNNIINQRICVSPSPQNKIQTERTPHQNTHKVKNLTPTFRNPKKYIEATQQVMKKISPISKYEKNDPAYYNHLPSEIPSTSAFCDSIINMHTDLQDQSTENDVNEPTHEVQNFNKQTTDNLDNSNYTSFEINVVVETYNDISSDEEVNNKKCSTDVAVEHFDPELPTTKQFLQNPDQTDLPPPAALESGDVLLAVEQSDSVLLAMEHSDSVLLALEHSDSALLAMEYSDSALLPLETYYFDSPLLDTVQSNSDTGQCNPDLLSGQQIKSPSNSPNNSIAGENEDVNNDIICNEINFDCVQSESDTEAKKKKTTKVRKSKRKLNFNKSYLDFIDDDPDTLLLNEAFPSESSSFEISEESTSSVDEGI